MHPEAPPSRRLADLPGPSGLPVLGNALQVDVDQLHLCVERWCERHGDLFRFKIGPVRFVAVADAETIRHVLRARPDTFRRISLIESIFKELGVHGVFSAEGSQWRRQRRLIDPTFKASYLTGLHDVIADRVTRLLGVLDAAAASGATVDAHDLLMRFTVDVTTAVAFGHDLDTLRTEGDQLQADIKTVFEGLGRRVGAAFPYWRLIRLPQDRRLDAAVRRVRAVVDDIVVQTRARVDGLLERDEPPANLLEALLIAQETEEGVAKLDDDELFANVMTLLLAGEDTTANTMAWMLDYMAQHPDLQARMQAEADTVLGDARTLPTFRDVDRMRYIGAVAQETMRLRSTAPMLYMEAAKDTILADVQVPAGTAIAIMTRYAATKEENFSRAQDMLPERWLQADAPADLVHRPKSLLTFGAGPRICPGRSLAILETQLVMSMLARNFTVVRPPDAPRAQERFAFTMSPSTLPLRFELRGR